MLSVILLNFSMLNDAVLKVGMLSINVLNDVCTLSAILTFKEHTMKNI